MSSAVFCGNTDPGKVRTRNEDSYIAQYMWDKHHILAVAIDGVGGYEGGDVAAALAHKCIIEYLENYPNGERLDLLKQAVVSANNTILSERKNLPYSSMSCVLTAVLVELKEMRINMAHVGDTRLYQFANGILSKLSHDHSLVGYREEIGELTEEEAMKHPQRNVLGRDVGSSFLEINNNDYIETATFPLISKSTLLLCSDGLCDMLTSTQMVSILQKELTVEEKVSALINAANEAGGKDNVTAILVDVDLDDAPLATYTEEKQKIKAVDEQDKVTAPTNNRKKKIVIFLFCCLILLALGCYTAILCYQNTFNGKNIKNAPARITPQSSKQIPSGYNSTQKYPNSNEELTNK